jgi:hypothetical protein
MVSLDEKLKRRGSLAVGGVDVPVPIREAPPLPMPPPSVARFQPSKFDALREGGSDSDEDKWD